MEPLRPSRVREASGAARRGSFSSGASVPDAISWSRRVSGALQSETDNRQFSAEARGYAPPKRHLAAIAGSLAVHAIIIGAIVFVASHARPRGHDWVLAYVIDLGAGHGGAHDGGSPSARFDPGPASPPEEKISHALEHRPHKPHRVIASIPAPAPPITPELAEHADRESPMGDLRGTAASPGAGAKNAAPSAKPDSAIPGAGGGSSGQGAGSGAGRGSGPGNGGGGTSIAHADYGSDPAPLYPARSRRRGEQGTVTLHVLIAASGAVERVEMIASSGFRALDDAAIATVRERWRFTPARRDGIAIESWATVPIRFALTEASN
jgi:protein TonB